MLHKYEKIDEAMSACVALEYPLMVLLHGKLPSSLYNADEATRGTSTGSVAHTYSFLPPSYGTGTSHACMSASMNGSSSLFTDDTVPFEATLTAPSQDAANANAALGYLMRPANLSGDAAADRAEVAKAVAEGEELALVKDFPLGSLQGGAAQREALLITLLESRLGSVTLLHLIEEGTPAYNSFTSAVPVPHTGGNNEMLLPRMHIFYAPSVGMAPMALQGAALTPQNLHSCVQMSMLRPRIRADRVAGAAPASSLRTFFTDSVTAMNKEYERSRQQTSPAAAHSSPASPTSATGAAAVVHAVPAVQATGVSRADALAAAHLISLAGLPTCFATGPIPGASSNSNSSVKKILTTPAMTMQTVWRAVEKHLDWAQREVQQAQAASVWNGVTPPKPGAAFTLAVQPTAPSSAAAVEVSSMSAAATVRLQDFPANTVVQVRFEGAAAPAEAAAPPQQQTPQSSSSTDFVCEGDVCRRRQPGEAPATAHAAAPTSTAAPAASALAEKPPAPAAAPPSATTVKLHCSLPNGKTLDVAGLDPAVATLQSAVRPPVEAALGHSRFVFVCAYPAKRYSAQEDEPRPLQDVGLGRSSALRVVALDGAASPNAATAPSQPAGQTRQMLSNAASSLLGMFAGRRPNDASAAPSTTNSSGSNPPSSSPSQSSPPPRRAFTSMSQMLAANEDEERSTAVERLRQEQQQQQERQQDPANAAQRPQGKKSNRYFGGGSTEFVSEDNNDDGKDAMAGMTAEQQGVFLREQLQRLMRQQRSRMGNGGGDGDEEGEEGEEEEEAAPQRGGGAAPRPFQGQGRRLAGDDGASGASANAESGSPPAASSASEAKKNQ